MKKEEYSQPLGTTTSIALLRCAVLPLLVCVGPACWILVPTAETSAKRNETVAAPKSSGKLNERVN